MQKRVKARPKFYVIVILLMALFFGISCGVSQHRLNKVSAHADALEAQKRAMEEKISSLTEELKYMQTDEFIIRYARDTLKMVMPGEIRYLAK